MIIDDLKEKATLSRNLAAMAAQAEGAADLLRFGIDANEEYYIRHYTQIELIISLLMKKQADIDNGTFWHKYADEDDEEEGEYEAGWFPELADLPEPAAFPISGNASGGSAQPAASGDGAATEALEHISTSRGGGGGGGGGAGRGCGGAAAIEGNCGGHSGAFFRDQRDDGADTIKSVAGNTHCFTRDYSSSPSVHEDVEGPRP